MQLVILAAGMGSRFGGLKQIEPIDNCGNFIIDYSINDAIEAGFDNVVFIIKKEMEETFKNTIGKRFENRIHISYAFQKNDIEGRIKPLGTAHAILSAKDKIKGNFMIINADDYYGKESYKLASDCMKSLRGNNYANIVFEAINTITENGSVKRGICFENSNHELTSIVESSIIKTNDNRLFAIPLDKKEGFYIHNNQLVSMNMFIFTHDILNILEDEYKTFLEENKNDLSICEFLIPSVVSKLVSQNKANVRLIKTPSIWYGVTYKEDKEKVVNALRKMVDEGKYNNICSK